MFGLGSPRWLRSATLVLLMVAFYGVNSGLYLASPVPEMAANSSHLVKSAQFGRFLGESTKNPNQPALECVRTEHKAEFEPCREKSKKEDYAEITEEECKDLYAVVKCSMIVFCASCSKFDIDLFRKQKVADLESSGKERCKEWVSKQPEVITSCSGGDEKAGGASGGPSHMMWIILGVVGVVVALIVAIVVYCLMCSGDSKGHSSAKPSKSTKGGKSTKSGKMAKSGVKSTKSGKSAKSLKGGKSSKSKKGGKSGKK